MFGLTNTFTPLLALAVLICTTGCIRDKLLFSMDPKFSVNLMQPTRNWPDLESMSPAEIEVFEKYGRPDYFRPWYNRKGELLTRWETLKRDPEAMRKSWIYIDEEIEVVFQSPSNFETRPVNDRMRTLCERGDPMKIEQLREGSTDKAREAWTYWDVGEKYFFTEDGRFARPKQRMEKIGRGFTRM